MKGNMVNPKMKQNIPNGWRENKLLDCFDIPSRLSGIKLSEYEEEGEFPVFDQGKDYISGYSSNKDLVVKNTPAILFGDHTRVVKYIKCPFVAGADGTKIFYAKNNFDPTFLYYLVLNQKIPNTGYNRHFKFFKDIKVLHPESKAEQQKIADIFTKVDEDIAKTQEVIKVTEKLRLGLMQRLYTRGVGHTKFKETKIGQIPEEWGISLMAEKIDFQEGPGILAKDFHESGIPLIRLEGINSGSLLDGCNYLNQDLVAKKWSHFKLQKGDILLSSSASLGRVTTVGDEGIGAIIYTGIIRFRPKDSSVLNDFIQCFLTSPIFQNQIGSHDTGSTIKHFGPTHLKKMWFVIPSINEQKEIAEILSAVDEKISVNKKLKEKLVLLKKGLMQDLLSGKVRTSKITKNPCQ